MLQRKICTAVAGACALLGASAANAAIGFRAGDWDIDFSGNVNGFATWTDCDNAAVSVQGGLACNKPGGEDESAIESGLLPSALVFNAKTKQMGFDIGVTLGFYPGLNDDAAGPGKVGLGNTSIDMRQNFLTFGQDRWGTIKVGRDIGLFASDAILSDMTLLGVGSTAGFLGGNTTLGRIGVGYIYTDWIPQITYSSPKWGGFQLDAGIFEAFNLVAFGGTGTANPNSAVISGNDEPAYQAKVGYEWTGPFAGKVWASYAHQEVSADGGELGSGSVEGDGFDVGIRIGLPAGLEAVAYYYDAEGLGTTAIGFDAGALIGGSLRERDSDGGYLQLTWKIPATRLKLGVSYGESNLDRASGEPVTALVEKNESLVVGAYYALTKSLNLVAEYVKTEAEAHSGAENEDDSIAVGAILFF
ncbi:MAG TPA: porin [Blastocatellia bacterium]|nr:porin [Blastocatellia bacterium]